MTLNIKEIAWGIDRINGGSKERVTADLQFDCKVGSIKVGKGDFSIDEVGENHIVLTVHYENNPSANKSWTIEKGEMTGYFPRSFDGGYKYKFSVK